MVEYIFFLFKKVNANTPLFLQICSGLNIIKVQPSPVSHMSPAALLSVSVWCWAWTSWVIQEITVRFVSIGLKRRVLHVTHAF